MNLKEKYHILIVDDEQAYRETLQLLFESEGYVVKSVSSGEEAIEVSEKEYFPIIVTDIMMNDMDGITLLKKLKNMYHNQVEIIMVTGYGSIGTAVETMKKGAFGYFIKSNDPEELILEVKNAVESLKVRGILNYKDDKDMLLTSKNSKMEKIWGLCDAIAESNANVIITGESGTGKEIIANRIHYNSMRRDRPFIAINCQSLPSNLIESELFGYEKGAFTGANKKHIGKLEKCVGGTIFLDEIGDMSLDTQVKLLRVLETKKIERIGSNEPIDIDFRIVSATNKNIYEAVENGTFREDLFYRINTFEINLPPLRERKEDIPELINIFIKKFSKETGKFITGIEPETEKYLLNYGYPGNIRELKNIIERLVILSQNDGELCMQRDSYDALLEEKDDMCNATYKNAKQKFEKIYILKILNSVDGNITKAAEQMNLSRRQLFNKIKELNIEESEYK